MTCGAGSCTVICSGGSSCVQGVSCAQSCSCSVTCSGLLSCAGGVTVVNIDNGFGAAFAATRINRKRS